MAAKVPRSLELLIQASAWIGGILAAAVGGFLVAFGSKETPPEVIERFKWALIVLVLALLATWYVQFHAARYARELELAATTGTPPKTSAGASMNRWTTFQVGCQMLALVLIGYGIVRYQGPAREPWSIVAHEASGPQISYLLKVGGALRLLVSDAQGQWRTCTVDVAAPDGRVPCPAGQPTPAAASGLRPIGDAILFDRLQYSLKYRYRERDVDLTPVVCEAKRSIHDAGVKGILVVGSHDRDRIPGGAAVASNESLARLRAQSVADFLGTTNDCGGALEPIVAFNGAPVLATRETPRGADVSSDRSVRIYGFVQ